MSAIVCTLSDMRSVIVAIRPVTIALVSLASKPGARLFAWHGMPCPYEPRRAGRGGDDMDTRRRQRATGAAAGTSHKQEENTPCELFCLS